MNLNEKLKNYIVESQTYNLKNSPLYLKIISLIYRLLGRKLIARLFITLNNCKNCNLCFKICPEKAIYIKKKIFLRNKNCKGCFLCASICPEKSIVLPLTAIIGAILLIFLPYDDFIKNIFMIELKQYHILSDLFSILLWTIGYIIALFLYFKLYFYLGRISLIKKLQNNNFIKKIYYKIHPLLIFPVIIRKKN